MAKTGFLMAWLIYGGCKYVAGKNKCSCRYVVVVWISADAGSGENKCSYRYLVLIKLCAVTGICCWWDKNKCSFRYMFVKKMVLLFYVAGKRNCSCWYKVLIKMYYECSHRYMLLVRMSAVAAVCCLLKCVQLQVYCAGKSKWSCRYVKNKWSCRYILQVKMSVVACICCW